MPSQLLEALRERLLPLIAEVCTKYQSNPSNSLVIGDWRFGSRKLCLVLLKNQWSRLSSYLEVPEGLSALKARKVRTAITMSPERIDFRDRAWCSQPPAWRVSKNAFREEGILLPFRASRKHFDTPNPSFFQQTDLWPMTDSADPLEGWPLTEIIKAAGFPSNDLYGGLYFHLKDVFTRFCKNLSKRSITFVLTHADAVVLSGALIKSVGGPCLFDRIEVSNITDMAYLGPAKTLELYGPLLRERRENPHATLIGLFLNLNLEKSSPLEKISVAASTKLRLDRYISISPSDRIPGRYSAKVVKRMSAFNLFLDYDGPFSRYMEKLEFARISRDAGLVIKDHHTIVAKWPLRLLAGASQRQFAICCASGHDGSQRYVEWKRRD
ncbi:hypothetical protein MMC13_005872 [Lambiella insularis]|nr:hypothetical protein [Lambiella insularis]